MSFLQGLFNQPFNFSFSNQTTSSSSPSSSSSYHSKSKSKSIKSHHQKQPSLSLRSNPHLPTPHQFSRRQLQREDEEVYGPPSPHPSPPLSKLNSHQTFKPASTSTNSSPSPSPSPSSPPSNLNPTSSSTTDELFLSEHYPPIQSKLYPFFNERLSSPIGMGKGQLIINQHQTSNHNLQSIWNRISKNLIKFNPDLIETLSYSIDHLSLSNLESTLSSYHLSLPTSVKDSLKIHDGQDVYSTSSASSKDGLIYGLWLMSSEEIETEYGFWRKLDHGQLPNDAFNATDFSKPLNDLHHPTSLSNQMSSCPAGWVHETYSHPGWLPLITDRVGNYIGVDLSPPMILDPDQDLTKSFHSNQNIIGGGQGNSQASVGQVIAFGREIDEKVVLWNGDGEEGWGKWLSSFADDLEEGQFSILGKRHGSNSKDRFSNRGESNEIQASVRREDHEKGWKDEIEDDQEEEEEEDGIGELGYFHDGFDSTDDSKEFKTWKLLNQYRGMNVIEALCLRSKQRWSEIGLHSSRSSLRTDQHQPSIHSQPTPGPSNSNLTHSPHQHPPPGFASGSHASLPSQPDTPIAFVTPPSPRQSTDQIGRPEASTSQNLNVIPPSHKVRKRSVPPPPTSLSLPTMDDMIQAGSLESNVEDEEGIGLEEGGGKEVRMENEGRGRMLGLGRNELIGMSRIKRDERKIENEV